MNIMFVEPFSSMLKLKENANIYDIVFKMHTKLTATILFVCSVLVSSYEFFGKPINCVMLGNEDIKQFAEQMCWINGTFIYRNVKNFVNGREIWEKVPEYQKYYQWIIIVLLLQAILCYMPAYLWKEWECGCISLLCNALGSPFRSKDYEKQKTFVVDYLTKDNSRIHATYVRRYITCEVMNCVIVVINMLFLNDIFNQFWIRYLPVVKALFTTEGENFSSLASELFPKLVKCTFTLIGPSSTAQIRDTLCLLSMNIINEKIFAFLYIWYAILLVVSGCNLIKRSILIMSSTIRSKLLLSLAMSSKTVTKKQIKKVLYGDNIGDWFVLFKLGRNVDSIVFQDILDEVANTKIIFDDCEQRIM